MSEAAQKKFRKLVGELGRLIQAEADKGLADKKSKGRTKPQSDTPPWVWAFVDARWFSDAEGFISKLRVVLLNGSLCGLMRVTSDMKALLDKAWNVRKEDESEEWYGLKVTVSFEGEVTTDLDNDPNCVVDPMWFKS